QLEALSVRLDDGIVRQDRVEQSLETVREDLLLRDDAVHTTLYELQSMLRSAALPTAVTSNDGPSDYERVIRRAQEIVRSSVPRGASVAVVSRGDDALLSRSGRTASHFPRTADGVWAGASPATSIGAIAQLESQRAVGVGFILFPKPALWWLEHYAGL